MIGDACVFALTQIANDFACEYGELVTRRAGPDIACKSEVKQKQCIYVYEYLKQLGLNDFGYEDDLTQVPHGVWSKIQYGGLLGLNELCEIPQQSNIDNISGVIEAVMQQFPNFEELPSLQVIASMQAYRARRRKK